MITRYTVTGCRSYTDGTPRFEFPEVIAIDAVTEDEAHLEAHREGFVCVFDIRASAQWVQ
jgi:hypothetical protein